jgi:steroid delta-isomerase-like uncharacterized protein
MRKWQQVGLFTAIAIATAGTVTLASGVANAQQGTASRSEAPAVLANNSHGKAKEEANKRVVLAFLKDVLNNHRGDHAARYFTSDMTWHGGTVGTVTGRDNVAGLMTGVVTGIPDLKTELKDIFVEGDKVVVRLVVTGHLRAPLLNVPATGQAVGWDAIDVYHLKNGKIREEWAGDDFVAFLNTTGTFKAPWIP